MEFHPDVLAAIGNTPLIRLRRASEETGCTILGKAEFMNPGGSVKDRAAKSIIEDALERGELRPGGTVVDGTAGNTGIGLTMVADALGLKSVIVIPETQSQEKKDALRTLGAELVEVPAVPYRNPNNYVKLAGRLAERLVRENPNGAIWAKGQFHSILIRHSPRPPNAPHRVGFFIRAISRATLQIIADDVELTDQVRHQRFNVRRVLKDHQTIPDLYIIE